MKRMSLAATWIAVAFVLLPTLAHAQRERPLSDNRYYEERRGPGGWERLGEISVRPRVERELLRVNPREGRFTRIGLRAVDGDIEIVEIMLRYANGEFERLVVNRRVRAGTNMPPVDLRGGQRRLREIEVAYRPFGPSRVVIFGEEGRQIGRWEQLGCQRVGLFESRDVIRVGRKEGTFRAIKLSVNGNKLRLDKMRIVYANGQVDEFRVRTVIPEGSESRPIDLSGRQRGIDRIELFYIPQITFGGRATVCAFGL